jgi:hypothetical protein
MRKFVGWRTMVAMVLCAGVASAQSQTTDPGKPAARNGAYGGYAYHAGLTCGVGASYTVAPTKATTQCGGVMTVMPFWVPLDIEAGIMGPQVNGTTVSGYLGANSWLPLPVPEKARNKFGSPMLVGGYTRMFETGHALDYGIAVEHPVDDRHSIQFEARDYWTFANPKQHNIVFRVVWLLGLAD